jgi:hypothetical protein
VQGNGERLAGCIGQLEGKAIIRVKAHLDERDQNNPLFDACVDVVSRSLLRSSKSRFRIAAVLNKHTTDTRENYCLVR